MGTLPFVEHLHVPSFTRTLMEMEGLVTAGLAFLLSHILYGYYGYYSHQDELYYVPFLPNLTDWKDFHRLFDQLWSFSAGRWDHQRGQRHRSAPGRHHCRHDRLQLGSHPSARGRVAGQSPIPCAVIQFVIWADANAMDGDWRKTTGALTFGASLAFTLVDYYRGSGDQPCLSLSL